VEGDGIGIILTTTKSLKLGGVNFQVRAARLPYRGQVGYCLRCCKWQTYVYLNVLRPLDCSSGSFPSPRLSNPCGDSPSNTISLLMVSLRFGVELSLPTALKHNSALLYYLLIWTILHSLSCPSVLFSTCFSFYLSSQDSFTPSPEGVLLD